MPRKPKRRRHIFPEELEKIIEGYEMVNFMPTRERLIAILLTFPVTGLQYTPGQTYMEMTTSRPLTAAEAFRLAQFTDSPDEIGDNQTVFTIGWK